MSHDTVTVKTISLPVEIVDMAAELGTPHREILPHLPNFTIEQTVACYGLSYAYGIELGHKQPHVREQFRAYTDLEIPLGNNSWAMVDRSMRADCAAIGMPDKVAESAYAMFFRRAILWENTRRAAQLEELVSL